MSNQSGLVALEATLSRDMELLNYPAKPWVLPRSAANGQAILDVLVAGGGQGGLAVASGLMQRKISNILVVDKNPQGSEGPWRTFARMPTLRTPKHVTGPDQGNPNLTIRAWYEAQWGAESWDNLKLVPRTTWAQYLEWYRKFLGIPVRNDTTVGALEWNHAERCFSVPVQTKGTTEVLLARKVVLATGIDGSGRWEVPGFISSNLPKTLYAHTSEHIDFEALKGKRIGVMGAGASAFDNALVALSSGASEVHVFYRRRTLPNVNPFRWMENIGFLDHFADLSDAERWRFILQIVRMGQLPPQATYTAAVAHSNFHMHGESPWLNAEAVDGKVRITTPNNTMDFDYVILGTGFVTDLSLRPELVKLEPNILLWKDRYSAPADAQNEDMSRHPYLGSSFEFQEKTPGCAPYLPSLFNYTYGCLLSLGLGGASISGMKYSVPKVVRGITRQLFMEDSDLHFASLQTFDAKEF